MTKAYLVTHSGGFHADELLSSVILTRLFPEARIVRSRAPEWVTPSADRIIYDVGGAYDAERGIFDHHQRGAPLRQDGQPYSSFGLIWKHFGRDYLLASGLPEEHVEAVHASFDESYVLPTDLVDNGALNPSTAGPLAALTLPVLLETLKPVFDDTDPEATDRAFHQALALVRSLVEAKISGSAAKLRAEAMVTKAIAAAGQSRILELPFGMPFRSAIVKAGADHLLFVVHPREPTGASRRSASPMKASKCAPICPLPGPASTMPRWKRSAASRAPPSATTAASSPPPRRGRQRLPWPSLPSRRLYRRDRRDIPHSFRDHWWYLFGTRWSGKWDAR